MVGCAAGAEHDIAAYFAARYFGLKHFGAIYGLLYTLYNVGAGLGPPLAGAALCFGAALLVGTLGAYPREVASD